ncbi:Non-functional NADPH-dependent codeinone reductase 2 [Platanthera zijinensis]|uniref:Non-functional NADPH-dependent codeinone reductase 2 n=1 Tax=Platanthera zijinensis TaxID=2320716 RepID=A0AAP0B763_9ASPA
MSRKIPVMALRPGEKGMPAVGLGTVAYPRLPVGTAQSVLFEAIEAGYRHFDTATLYNSEPALGGAIAEALRRGLVGSRDEFFITTKLWCSDAHAGRVVPALRQSLRELQLDYVDLYLVHWPVSIKPSKVMIPFLAEDVLPMDLKSVWEEMEECHRLGLTKSIGVSNFSCKKLDFVLSMATIPPSVNQVEMHPLWQQKKLIDFCSAKGILVSAYSPLGANGAPWGTPKVMECQELKEIAAARGKSLAQVCLRWIHEQGASIVVKSYNRERMRENLDIFDWKLNQEDLNKIQQLPQYKGCRGAEFLNPSGGGIKSLEELWDGEI